MISNSKPKTNKKLIIVSVLVLTILTLNVSYSAFFDVKTQPTINSFTSGTLDVVIDSTSTKLSGELKPVATSTLPTAATTAINSAWPYATLKLTNSGTLPADFAVTLSYDTANASERLSFTYLNIGIHDGSKWVAFGTKFYTPVTSLTSSSTDVYPILRDTIQSNSTRNYQKTYKIFIWLSENTPITEIGKLVNLKINVRSTTVGGQSNNNGQPSVTLK